MMKILAALMLCAALPAQAAYFDDHPLTASDVNLYLQVMDKAAARAAAMRAAQKPCPKMPEFKHGQGPTLADVQRMTNAANCAAAAASVMGVDDTVAKEMGVTAKYEPIRDAVEAQVSYDPGSKDGAGNGSMAAGGCGGSDCDPTGGHATAAQKALWAHQDAMDRQNRAFLEPYKARIQRDEFKVRKLPK